MTYSRITIGITCYNAEATIGRALQSALTQDWPNLEVVVVDDCSSDGSWGAITQAAAGDPRVLLIRHSMNRGAAVARNSIIEAASGEYIAFFDDDDISYPARIATQCEAISRQEQYSPGVPVACFASGAREYPNGYRKLVRAIGSEGPALIGTDVVDYLLFNERRPGLFYGGGTPTCSLMIRTHTLRMLGGFDVALRRVEDVDLAIRIGIAGGHFVGCPQDLYLQYATFSSDKSPLRNLESELKIIEKNRSYLKPKGLYHYAKDWFRFREAYFSKRYPAAIALYCSIFLRHPMRTTRHLFKSAPARLRHERSMRASRSHS
jgi:glycosyltransferase involved in cell wall biosynthesis